MAVKTRLISAYGGTRYCRGLAFSLNSRKGFALPAGSLLRAGVGEHLSYSPTPAS